MRRAVAPGFAYHVTQRGADQRVIFREDRDRFIYLSFLRQAADRYGISFEGFCLMPNHVHLIAIPERENSLHLGMQWAHLAYSRYAQARHGGRGRLWQPRLLSCLLDGPDRWRALAYVEMNPVRSRLAAIPEDCAWSSARTHLNGDKSYLRLEISSWSRDWDAAAWATQLQAMRGDYRFWRDLESATRTGRPLAPEQTITWLESQLGCSLRSRRRAPKPEERALAQSAQGSVQPDLGFGN